MTVIPPAETSEKHPIFKNHIFPMMVLLFLIVGYGLSVFFLLFLVPRIGNILAISVPSVLFLWGIYRFCARDIARTYIQMGFSRRWNCYEGNYKGTILKISIGFPGKWMGCPVDVSFDNPSSAFANTQQLLSALSPTTQKALADFRERSPLRYLTIEKRRNEINVEYLSQGASKQDRQQLAEKILDLAISIKNDMLNLSKS